MFSKVIKCSMFWVDSRGVNPLILTMYRWGGNGKEGKLIQRMYFILVLIFDSHIQTHSYRNLQHDFYHFKAIFIFFHHTYSLHSTITVSSYFLSVWIGTYKVCIDKTSRKCFMAHGPWPRALIMQSMSISCVRNWSSKMYSQSSGFADHVYHCILWFE